MVDLSIVFCMFTRPGISAFGDRILLEEKVRNDPVG